MAKRMCLALAGTPSVLLFHLADDSSSSEDDDDGPAYEAMFRELFDAPCAVPKVKEYVLTVVNAYSDNEFRRNFRLARVPCYDLIDQFEGSSFFSSTSHHGGSPTKTAEEHILSFCHNLCRTLQLNVAPLHLFRYVANKSSMRECALLFNMADSMLAVIDRVLNFLCSIALAIICFAADKGALANGLKKRAGFPNVIGCIDGTYIPTRCPNSKTRSTYINRHDQVSITMQGIRDAKGRFQDVFTGPPSKVHDARVLRLSVVQQDLPTICAVNKYHLLGDAAYPIREHLLTPFKNYGTMTKAKVEYNQRHASTRVVIENTFGMMKQRFRQLRYVEFTTVDKITQLIIWCCVSHNICMDAGDMSVEDILTDEKRRERREDIALHARKSRAELEAVRQPRTARDNVLRQLGEAKRNTIAQLF
ncbi:putative nuclease HARBI1 [Ixodes scapularis]|uniref:putative nuclease HARBI1 n=1 Tax=Ixodes scapularis TaxID=6945 RepID=UPI001A9DD03E|nr:putative nuclease HARBI1 [Ixodes scapularis]